MGKKIKLIYVACFVLCSAAVIISSAIAHTVTTQQLSLVVGKDGKREVRPENLQIQIGGSSVIGKGTLTQKLTLEGQPLAPKYNFVTSVIK